MVSVSIIIPVHNAERWFAECLRSVFGQTFKGKLQLSIFNDSCTDKSMDVLETWRERLIERGIDIVVGRNPSSIDGSPKGVGFAKNRAVEQSGGDYLCFLDADDVQHEDRVEEQYKAARRHPNALIGSQFWREPEGSTVRFTKWANSLTPKQLYTQVYTSHGPTVIMPTWFCSRSLFDKVGGFDEGGKGVPEDLLFFNKFLHLGGEIHRIDKPLLMYRYHQEAATFSVLEETIWNIRVAVIQERVVNSWDRFVIWNAGRQGRQFYRSLSDENRKKVEAFCDVDVKKISKGFYTYEESKELPKPKIPIIHFSKGRPPFVICLKQDLTSGIFESNLASLNLEEGKDYFHFN